MVEQSQNPLSSSDGAPIPMDVDGEDQPLTTSLTEQGPESMQTVSVSGQLQEAAAVTSDTGVTVSPHGDDQDMATEAQQHGRQTSRKESEPQGEPDVEAVRPHRHAQTGEYGPMRQPRVSLQWPCAGVCAC